jgi:hypothetical protein
MTSYDRPLRSVLSRKNLRRDELTTTKSRWSERLLTSDLPPDGSCEDPIE